VEERGQKRAGGGPSPGWDRADAAAYDRLWVELREATADVQTHGWWKTCRDHGVQGANLVAIRQALKTAKRAVPLRQGTRVIDEGRLPSAPWARRRAKPLERFCVILRKAGRAPAGALPADSRWPTGEALQAPPVPASSTTSMIDSPPEPSTVRSGL
jgi:hypothetical protein